jgi:two-component system, OmpR family, phosphate regulon response regulator PhoB
MIPRLPGPPRDQPPPLVLVADEEPAVVEAIVEALQLHHYRVSVAEDGDEALRRAHGESPDLIIASVRLKSRGGLEICGTLRREVDWGDMPIVILSAASDAEARVEALAHGADDFLTKPFSPRELVARVHAVLRRTDPETEDDVLDAGDVVLDRRSRTATVDGSPVELTAREFDLIWHLAERPGIVLRRERILERVWGLAFPGGTRTVDVHVGQLRRKLDRPELIRTVRGAGYKLVP